MRIGIDLGGTTIEALALSSEGGNWLASAGRPAYTVSIMEFRNGKVMHETQYFADPFETPAWRRQWVQQIAAR